ncbi:Vegetative incompatibility protein HET-E-1 [Ceratocystis lukuohia]|uniref:Vegetative incompatibility protein HET-E-1 n=1 Tax=Ceratocystis lukuohia TaxID=2019550 RepID=A0ABR4MMW7_9PEZI
MAKPQIRSLLKRLTRHHSSPEPPMIPSHVPAQSEPGQSQPTPLSAPSRLASKPESASSLDLRERIWKQAYDESRQEEPDLVEALENIVLAQLCNNEKPTGFSSLIQGRERIDRKVTLCEVQEFVWDRIERMEKETSIKQDISGALQAMQAIRGIINGAIRAATEAAAVWATVCLSVEVLSNPITEALENRRGLQYVVGKMEWYWNLADLLLDKNQCETTTAKMQGELEREMVHLFQKLLLYQMRSIRLYHHSRPTTITRDTFRIGDWTGQLNNIKKAEETVERHIDQCNTQESKIWLQSLKDTTGVLQQSLQNIEKTAQKQIEQRAKTHKDDHDKQCLSDLHITDPQIDKKNIEEQKGGLLKDCYEWIFNHRNFRRFQSETESRILWIRGHVGKGKTMVLCGLINELESYSPAPVAYFFCQAIHGWRLSAATSVLRGLIYHLARQNPQLTKYVREKHDDHKNVFNSADAWKNLCEIMTQMLNDPILENVILIVDALDECSQELESLLGFITRPSSAKWILSSRNWSYIERRLDATEQTVKIHLELNPDPLSKAVRFYINVRVERLAKDNGYDEAMKNAVLEYLIANAQDTFLWVALACQELSNLDPMKQHTLSALETLPPGIDPLYKRMLKRICQSEDGPICREVLATALTVYQPITLQQLAALVKELEDYGEREHENASQELRDIIKDARRFLLFHGRAIEVAPLQAYVSAMIFSPAASLTRKHFSHEQPDWVELKPKVGEDSNPCLQTLGGHCDNVTSVVFSHDGQQLASGSGDKTVKIWDPESGACMQTFEGHDGWVRSVAFSHDGQRLASSSDDKTVKIWDVASGACLRTLEGHEDRVKSAVFSKDGRRIVSGSDDETVKIWDAISGEFLQTLEDHHSWVISVVFSHDGRRLASGSADETIKIWDPTSGACLRTLRGHCRDVVSVVFSNDGQRLASGSDDKTVKIWDPDSGECLLTLEGHDRWVTSVAFSNDGQRLASVSWDKTTKIWDANSGACLQILEGHDGCVTSVVFSPDSQRLASGSADETVKIWNATSGTSLQTLEGHHNYVSSVVLSNDGQRLASGSTGKTLKIWDPTSGTCLKTLEGHHLSVSSVVFSNDGLQLASGSRDNTLKIWDVTSGSCLQTLKGHDGWITSVVFSHNNQRLASGSADETIKIWNAASGACLKTFGGHRHSVASMAFSKDGQRLALGSWDGTIRIWDGTSGACLQTLEGHDYWVTSVMFSNDGWQLASRSADRTAKIWDVISGTCLRTLPTSDTTYYAPSDSGFLDAGISVAVSVPSIHQSSLIHSNPYSYGFSDDNSWITKDGRKLVWLPLDYRPLQSSAVAGTRLALVCPPNRIIVIGFRSTGWHEKSVIQLNHR